MVMDIQVNYRNKKRYKTAKYPIRQPKIITWLIKFLGRVLLIKDKYVIDNSEIKDLKSSYMLLCNHMHFVDFDLNAIATYPRKVSNVVSIDGCYRRPWLMELMGSVITRKFTLDLHLIKSINRVLSRGDVLCMYPEARYSPCGIRSYIPDSVGKIVKKNKTPVVIGIHHGNHLRAPFWNYRQKKKVPLYYKLTYLLTAEQVEKMSVDEINKTLQDALDYNEYNYQKENNILITEPYRANGLHKILYQCPHCKAENMHSEGTEIYCAECGKRWYFNADGSLIALKGETEFSHIPDWFEWERANVVEQVKNGTYHYEDEIEVYGFPRCWRFIKLGKAKFVHDINEGITIEGFYRGKPYRMQRLPMQINSLHVEYDYRYVKPFDAFDVSSEKDSLYCYPTKRNVLTKLGFATEAIHQLAQEKVNQSSK